MVLKKMDIDGDNYINYSEYSKHRTLNQTIFCEWVYKAYIFFKAINKNITKLKLNKIKKLLKFIKTMNSAKFQTCFFA